MRIATTAMELFLDRGFEHVSVAEVAAAAGVTEKTVFNHFATKEELVFPQDQDTEAALLDALRSRTAGTSALTALRTFFLDGYAQRFPRDAATRRRTAKIAKLVADSPGLQARGRAILDRVADRVSDQLAAELGAGPGDLRPVVVANAVIAVHQAVLDGYRDGLRGRESAAKLSERMHHAAAEAFDLLANGLGSYAADPHIGSGREPTTVDQVLDVAQQWDRTLIDNDPVAVARFMTDDWVYVTSTGPVLKTDIVGWIANGRLAHHSMEVVGDCQARVIAGSVLVTARKRSTGTWDGRPYSADEWITQTYTHTGDGWRCAVSQKTDASLA